MKLTLGMIVVLVSMVLFYLRIAYLRGRKKRYEREFTPKRRKVNGRSKGAVLPHSIKGTPPYSVRNWFLVGISVILVIFGLLMYNNMSFLGYDLITDAALLKTFTPFWYIPLAGGILMLAMSIKIETPYFDEDQE